MRHRLGVCAWSLRPKSPADLARRVGEVGVGAVQIPLDPLRDGPWSPDELVLALGRAGVAIPSGMMAMAGEDYSTPESIRATGGVRPDGHWPANLEAARGNARLARRLGLGLVTLHGGFLPHDPADPGRRRMVERLRAIVDVFAAEGVRVGFETGQETAETLLGVLEELDRPGAGVNFDPANMLLYGMGDPIEALRLLAPRVLQIHVKDARRAREPGTWGVEVPVGAGEVDWGAFFDATAGSGLSCDLMIEREAGEDRIADVCRAREVVEGLLA